MPYRIVFDGLNLALEEGTGVATYARTLSQVARDLGHEIGVIYGSPQAPSRNPVLREIAFFDERRSIKRSLPAKILYSIADLVCYYLPVKPTPLELSGVVVTRQFDTFFPVHDHIFVTRNLFANADRRFYWTKGFVNLVFDPRPDVFHCTYQLPLRSKSACNVYTIHDLVPLRLPFATLDDKRQMFRLLKKVASRADHIVTVSENSKRDIIELLDVDESRITNTYQAVSFPKEDVERSEATIAEQLSGSFGLELHGYLLFFGALEPKKNVGRLIEAYLASGVDVPLVLIAGEGWHNEPETTLLQELRENDPGSTGLNRTRLKRRVRRFRYVRPSTLITLIRGARAVVFPSLYEGFGLPVLEAMTLGTPVVTSRESSLPEIAGDAALLVDPYNADDIARAITTIVGDADLRAELSRRGRLQAAKFSVERYRERVEALYASLR
ncbi:MAG TPA: glycosyltransferase family 1 protein [Stellaceae bacterium]|nr:glycosyltransferase family 1 protein [Stellaceae bacterium]